MTAVASHTRTGEFEQLYIRLRSKEGRVYTDEQVAQLPFIDKNHAHYKEWKIRTSSFNKLLAYIQHKRAELNILEVGCGNGWLSAQIATGTKAKVTGIDINNTELEQAKRVFQKQPNLHFLNSDLGDGIFGNRKFDIIIFAASIQYFSSLSQVLAVSLRHLTANGEIHLLDSNFYHPTERLAAKERTKDYYASMGFPELSNYYYHHSIEDLEPFRFTVLHNPGSWRNKLTGVKNPFHWIVIKDKISS